jgi:hypothetical protein
LTKSKYLITIFSVICFTNGEFVLEKKPVRLYPSKVVGKDNIELISLLKICKEIVLEIDDQLIVGTLDSVYKKKGSECVYLTLNCPIILQNDVHESILETSYRLDVDCFNWTLSCISEVGGISDNYRSLLEDNDFVESYDEDNVCYTREVNIYYFPDDSSSVEDEEATISVLTYQ